MSGVKRNVFCLIALWLAVGLASASAQDASVWVGRWNKEEGREFKLNVEDVLVKSAGGDVFGGLQVAGFAQSDGTFPLGKVMWKGESFSPLTGFGKILSETGFVEMDDPSREAHFLRLLQQTYGLLGTRVYTGKPMRQTEGARPEPLRATRGADGSHRFQVWFYEFPVKSEEGEWREVLYYVSPDGKTVRVRTLDSHFPVSERLNGFPDISEESFE